MRLPRTTSLIEDNSEGTAPGYRLGSTTGRQSADLALLAPVGLRSQRYFGDATGDLAHPRHARLCAARVLDREVVPPSVFVFA
jgi:hypothetical protein